MLFFFVLFSLFMSPKFLLSRPDRMKTRSIIIIKLLTHKWQFSCIYKIHHLNFIVHWFNFCHEKTLYEVRKVMRIWNPLVSISCLKVMDDPHRFPKNTVQKGRVYGNCGEYLSRWWWCACMEILYRNVK